MIFSQTQHNIKPKPNWIRPKYKKETMRATKEQIEEVIEGMDSYRRSSAANGDNQTSEWFRDAEDIVREMWTELQQCTTQIKINSVPMPIQIRMPYLCPVCNGGGTVPFAGDQSDNRRAQKTCHGCDGKGIVWG
jgi:DnaJ-class molecular chaperone